LGIIKEGEEVQDGSGERPLAYRSKYPYNITCIYPFIIDKMKQLVVEKMS